MNDSAKQAIVAAEDRTFWTNTGIDFKRRAARRLGERHRRRSGRARRRSPSSTRGWPPTCKGVTYSRKLREAVIAWKLDDTYCKEEILGFYLNTVPFGRGAYGIEAAAQAFFGKTVRRDAPPAQQLTQAEAMVLCAMVKQPEADPADPEGSPGYDPRRNAMARQNSIDRWNYIRDGMVKLGYLTPDAGGEPGVPGHGAAGRPRRRAGRAWTGRPAWWSTTCSASCGRPNRSGASRTR